MKNEQDTYVNIPDLSRVYIISGCMMFNGDEEMMLVEADSSGEAEAALRLHIADEEVRIEQTLVISSASLRTQLPARLITSA